MKKGYSKYLHYENAEKLIQLEGISSVIQYEKWWQHNKPATLPRRPDMHYKGHGWKSWNKFLGNTKKPFKHVKKNFVKFDEAKRFVRSQGIKTFQEWKKFCREGNRPENIPACPEIHYKREWFSWMDFFGTNIKQQIKETIKNAIPLLYVIKTSNTPSNVFKINTTLGGKEAILKAQQEGAKIIAVFDYSNNVDWRTLVVKYANNYWRGDEDDYAFSNINAFLFELSNYLSTSKF